jgi:hypothetical protein
MTWLLFFGVLVLIALLLWSIQHWSISRDPYFGSSANELLLRGAVRGVAGELGSSELLPDDAGADATPDADAGDADPGGAASGD